MRKSDLKILRGQVKGGQDWMRRAIVLSEILRRRGVDTKHIMRMSGKELEEYMIKELNMARVIDNM